MGGGRLSSVRWASRNLRATTNKGEHTIPAILRGMNRQRGMCREHSMTPPPRPRPSAPHAQGGYSTGSDKNYFCRSIQHGQRIGRERQGSPPVSPRTPIANHRGRSELPFVAGITLPYDTAGVEDIPRSRNLRTKPDKEETCGHAPKGERA